MTSPFSTAKADPSITQEKCWEHLDFVRDLLASPGALQTHALQHQKFGPEIKRLTNELLHHAVDNVSFDEAEETPENFLSSFSPQVVELVNTYQKYLIEQMSDLSMMLQYLPHRELFSAVTSSDSFDEAELAKMGIKPDEVAALKAKVEELKNSGTQTVAAMKPSDRLMPIITAGVNAAGGQVEFAEAQMRIMNTMPPELVKAGPQALIASMIAAVVTVIAKRAQSIPVIAVTVQGAIEAVIAAKRALSIPFVAAYHMPASDVFHLMMTMGVDRIAEIDSPEQAEVREKQKAEVEQVFNRAAKETSTVFTGNGTKN